MKKQRKKIEMDERQKRLLLYVSLFIGAVFFAIWDPTQLWLVIGLGIGIVYGLAHDWIFTRDKKKNEPEPPTEMSMEEPESVEKIEEADRSEKDK
ncbi:MAG TPA: hypothetical protein VHR42_06945 [Clostridia bacterium]|nr:hypothetical protein [Clostridia bacterium]